MSEAKVTMTPRKVGPSASVIDIRGEINGFAENVLMDAYTLAGAGGVKGIVLNFTDLEYMNSSGIGLLVTVLIRAQRQGQRLLAYGLSEHYRQIFELTRLSDAIAIFNSEEEAIAAI